MSAPDRPGHAARGWTRRRLLAATAGGVAAAAFTGLELVEHGVLPGRQELDRLDGACSVSAPPTSVHPAGPSRSGTFFSAARHRRVGYTIAYPPGTAVGDRLPLVVVLHAFGADHASALSGGTLAQALAAPPRGQTPTRVALVAVDGGSLYWNPHPGDDPMAMIVDEMIPRCRSLGLGRRRIGALGISMGGYGALLLAERHPGLISAVAAISPAVWTSYAQARAANATAYASAADFARDDVVTHAGRLAGRPVRVASGVDDPFHPGVVALARALPRTALVAFAPGCHDPAFFVSQQPVSLAFLGAHLAA